MSACMLTCRSAVFVCVCVYLCVCGGCSWSRIGHLSLAEGNGQLQVLLFLLSKPLQPLTLGSLALSLCPLQLLSLVPKLQRDRGTETGRQTDRHVKLISYSIIIVLIYLK